jgi:prepilin peptidase CpaA
MLTNGAARLGGRGLSLMFETMILSAVALALIVGAVYDVATLTIPNWLSLALVGLFPAAGILAGFGPSDWIWHLAIGFAALCTGVAVFAFGFAGGGDAKLFAAGALYMGLAQIGQFVFAVALAGGVLVLLLLFIRRIPLPVALITQPWVARLYQKGQGVPYGVAIAIGALMVLPETHLALGLTQL